MNRLREIEIAGKTYPLNFSIRAAREIGERCGGIENIGAYMGGKKLDEQSVEALWMLCRLMENGAAYKRLTVGEEIILPDFETLEILIDTETVIEKVLECITTGSESEIKVEHAKNTMPTQSQ